MRFASSRKRYFYNMESLKSWRGWAFVLLLAGVQACKPAATGHPQVKIVTTAGTIVVELYEDKAPKTVAAFLKLVDDEVYDQGSFYRVWNLRNQPSDAEKAELVQGGLWNRRRKRPELPTIPHESTNITGLLHENGTISMARNEPGTASSEFFICIEKQPGLDYGGKNNADGQGYAPFGKVIKGMEVVLQIFHDTDIDQYIDPPVPFIKVRRN